MFLIFFALFVILLNCLLFAAEEDSELFQQGVQAYQEKDFDPAIEIFEKLSQKIFGHEPSFYNLGLAYVQKTKYPQAIEAFEQASLYNPYNLFSYKFLADLFILTKKYEDALTKIKDVLKRNPQDSDAHLKNGFLALKKNDLDAATKEFTFVRNLDPDDLASRINLAGLFLQSKNFDKAKSYLSEIENKTLGDAKTNAFRWALVSYLYRVEKQTQKAENTRKTAVALAPAWRRIKDPNFAVAPLQLEFTHHLLHQRSLSTLGEANLLEFQQSEASKRVVERIQTEKAEEKKKATVAVAKKKDTQGPFDLTGEWEHTVEYYDRNPITSNPINDVNMTSNLELDAKFKNGLKFSSEFEAYLNRWDHVQLDFFKINLKKDNDELDIGKFSAKNFPSALTHPTLEQGIRWWHRFERNVQTQLFDQLPQDLEAFDQDQSDLKQIPNVSQLYGLAERAREFFATWEVTVLHGRSKKPKNLDARKEKNENTYETSGQFEQWVSAFHIMAEPSDNTEIGFSYSRVKDDNTEASVSATTLAIESEAYGVDWSAEFLDGKLKTDGEHVRANYDENIALDDGIKNKSDLITTVGVDYELTDNWDLSYDLKRVGANYEVEGGYQTPDKLTQTWTGKYAAPQTKPWTVRSINLKVEPARVNLSKSNETSKDYLTFQPKISFTLPQDAKLSFDYKFYHEQQSCVCTEYKTRTLKTELEYEHEASKTTFKPSFTFERKDDRVAAPTDEKKRDFTLSVENKFVDNLTLKASAERERKGYVGATTKSYNQHKYSFEAKYVFVPGRCDSSLKVSIDDKDQTDTNDIEIDTLKFTFNYTSEDKNDKLTIEYERKSNIYDPWSDTSAYRQNYAKMKFTNKF
ncbi:tetratricopeptide repeat protein [Candidatus Omnitrophota bacterium]